MSRINRCYTPFVDNVMNFYASGHSVRETATEFDVTMGQVNHWAKVRRVSNGRTFRQGGQEMNMKRHLGLLPTDNSCAVKRAIERWTAELLPLGFLLLEWNGIHGKATLKCLKCGQVFERAASNLHKGVNCPYCVADARRIEQEAKTIVKRTEHEEREAEQKAKREEREKKHLERLNELHACKVCGGSYTILQYMGSIGTRYERDSGFCSKRCREVCKKEREKSRKKKMRENGTRSCVKHYTRAKRLGLPVESGISLKKLIERNGTTCAICGLPCYYYGDCRSDLYPSIDHIIPLGNDPDKKGGHTWANVQVAHRICNSNKRHYVGKEWNNGN
jgi:5-methylcytosine-specific restriction endonuclease McrA